MTWQQRHNNSSYLQMNNNQLEVVNFLDSIKLFEQETNMCMQNSVQEFNTITLNDKTKCDLYIHSNTEYMSKIYSNNIRLKEMKVPIVMANYCVALSGKYSAIYEQMGECNNIASGFKKSSDVNFKISSDNIKAQITIQDAELLKVFDSVGIKYENNNGQVQYWYQK